MEGQPLLGPSLDDYVNGFLVTLAAGVYVYPQAVELLLLVARADTEIDAAVADYVQHRHFFGHQYRVVQRQNDYGGSDADVLRPSGHRAQERPDAGQQPVARETVLAQPDFLNAHLLGVYNLLQCIVQRLFLGEVLVVRNDGENSELHAVPLLRVASIWPTLLH